MCVLKKLQYILPRKPLLRIYKSFIWPHLDYSDIIYGYPNNECFSPKIESYQYNAALAITRAIRGASLIKLYYELNLESLKFRRYFWRFCTFYKIQSSKLSPLCTNRFLKAFIFIAQFIQINLKPVITELMFWKIIFFDTLSVNRIILRPKENTLVSRNPNDKKNLHRSCRNFLLNQFN